MKYNHFTGAVATILCVSLLAGCAQSNPKAEDHAISSQTAAGQSQISETGTTDAPSMYASGVDSTNQTTIDLNNGSTAIEKSGTYRLTGTLHDGSIVVDVDKTADNGTVYLILDEANINSSTDTPINIKEAKQVVIMLEEGTSNIVTQANISTQDTEFPSGAIYSKADLEIAGEGTLTVTTQFNDGINSRDDLVITGANIVVEAIGDGIVGKDLLYIEKSTIQVTAGKDGLRSSNDTDEGKGNIVIASGNFSIQAKNDAIQAERTLKIEDGTFDLTTGDGYAGSSKIADHMTAGGPGQFQQETATAVDQESRKALKAGELVSVLGGSFTISSFEDAVHSNGSVTIEGGNFAIQCGDDGINADGLVTISKGEIDIANSYEGIEGSDITISGGNIQVVSKDDGINVNSQTGTLTISGGTIYIQNGGDGIDSNGNIVMSGGDIVIDTTNMAPMDTAIDYDGTLTKTGGTLKDKNGDDLDTTQHQPGGGGRPGSMGGGARPGREAIDPPQAKTSATPTT